MDRFEITQEFIQLVADDYYVVEEEPQGTLFEIKLGSLWGKSLELTLDDITIITHDGAIFIRAIEKETAILLWHEDPRRIGFAKDLGKAENEPQDHEVGYPDFTIPFYEVIARDGDELSFGDEDDIIESATVEKEYV